jgi:hypothetical protein
MTLCERADLNRDGKVTAVDMAVLTKQTGVCTDITICGGDLNGDGAVNSADVSLMNQAMKTCTSSKQAKK